MKGAGGIGMAERSVEGASGLTLVDSKYSA